MPILRSRKTQFLLSSFYFYFSAFLLSGKHLPEERKTPIGPIHIVFLLGPTQTSFSFPPAGTPEATSWEQGQMARPHIRIISIITIIICFLLLFFVWSKRHKRAWNTSKRVKTTIQFFSFELFSKRVIRVGDTTK